VRRTWTAVVVIAGMSAVSTACSTSKESPAASTPAASQGNSQSAAARLVPAALRSKGTVIVGTEGDYPPGSFVEADGRTLTGTDIDFANALGKALDLKVTLQASKFDTLIPGVQDGRYDIAISGIFDTKKREKVVDLVTYKQTGKSFFVKQASSKQYEGLASLCNSKVAVLSGSTELTDAQTQSKSCQVDVLTFADQNAANLAVSSGRADVGFVDSPLAGYLVEQTKGQFQLSGKSFDTVPNGMALPKGNGMGEAVRTALSEMMSNGQYTTILKKWGAQSDAIPAPVINGAQK